MQGMAASCQKTNVPPAVCRHGRGRDVVFLRHFCNVTVALLLLTVRAAPAHAANGDGQFLYLEDATDTTRYRTYTDSGESVGDEASAADADQNHKYVRIEANPQLSDAFMAISSSGTNSRGRIHIQRWDSAASTWENDFNLDSATDSVHSNADQLFYDIAYESNSGNALIVYSTGNTTDELGFYWHVSSKEDDAGAGWLGPCEFESNRTTGTVEWVAMASDPTSNDIAVVFSDSNDDVSAFIWSHSDANSDPDPLPSCATAEAYFTAEHTSALDTTMATTDNTDLSVAYEYTSGDIFVAYDDATTSTLGWATYTTSWATGTTSMTNDIGKVSLCTEFKTDSNQIGIAMLEQGTSCSGCDTETAIWDGSAVGNIDADRDITATSYTYLKQIGCAWVGTTGELVVVYSDHMSNNNIDWFTWNSTDGWATETDVSYGPGSGDIERSNMLYNIPGSNKIALVLVDWNNDCFVNTYNGTSWSTLNGDAAIELALEAGGNLQGVKCAGAFTDFDASPVADLTAFAVQKQGDSTKTAWASRSESLVKGYHVTRAEQRAAKRAKREARQERRAEQQATRAARATEAFERVTDRPIPALGGPTSGKTYQWLDTTADADVEYVYELEVIGRGDTVVRRVGPVTAELTGRVGFIDAVTGRQSVVTADSGLTAAPSLSRSGDLLAIVDSDDGLTVAPAASRGLVVANAAAAAASDMAQETLAALTAASLAEEAGTLVSGLFAGADLLHDQVLKLTVQEAGFYRVTGEELELAGWDVASLDPATLGLSSGGAAVPFHLVDAAEDGVFDATDYIQFWADVAETRFYKVGIYWLAQHTGGGIVATTLAAAVSGNTVLTFDHTARVEKNEAYYAELELEHHWFNEYELWSPDSYAETVTLDHITFEDDKATLRVGLQGISTWGYGAPAYNQQQVRISVNGADVGTAEWSGDTYHTVELDVNLSAFVDGDNTIRIEATDAYEQAVLVDYVEVTYPHSLHGTDGALSFVADDVSGSASSYKVRDVDSTDLIIYIARADGTANVLTDALTVTDALGAYVSFADDTRAGDRVVVIAASAVNSVPAAITAVAAPTDLLAAGVNAYVIIAPAAFHATLQAAFVAHRAATLVDAQWIYNVYAGGYPDPRAIRAFVLAAADAGAKNVLLVGDGTFDYRDYQETGVPQYIPAALVDTRWGEMASVNWFATPEGEMLPTLTVGLWPARNETQLQAIIDKTLAYEAMSATHRAALLADDEPGFRAMMDRVAEQLLVPEQATKVYYGDIDAVDAKDQFIAAINGGVGLAGYAGHGGVTILSSAKLLTTDDVSALNNAGTYPVLMIMGCLAGYHIYPTGYTSLAEELLYADDKGIVGALAPGGLTGTHEQQLFSEAWVKALVEDNVTLGEALLKAQQSVFQYMPPSKATPVIQTFNLLADPALTLK